MDGRFLGEEELGLGEFFFFFFRFERMLASGRRQRFLR